VQVGPLNPATGYAAREAYSFRELGGEECTRKIPSCVRATAAEKIPSEKRKSVQALEKVERKSLVSTPSNYGAELQTAAFTIFAEKSSGP
jgi:hypothetical protein